MQRLLICYLFLARVGRGHALGCGGDGKTYIVCFVVSWPTTPINRRLHNTLFNCACPTVDMQSFHASTQLAPKCNAAYHVFVSHFGFASYTLGPYSARHQQATPLRQRNKNTVARRRSMRLYAVLPRQSGQPPLTLSLSSLALITFVPTRYLLLSSLSPTMSTSFTL